MADLVLQDKDGLAPSAETAMAAVAAQAEAMVKARWVVAQRVPRNWGTVQKALVKLCENPAFAKGAWYHKPIGKGVQGLSIRFVEAALLEMGNVSSEARPIYDDEEKRIIDVSVTDYERNVSHSQQITITKTVERKRLRDGQQPIRSRTNSFGDKIFIVEASDDDLANKEGALVSKALRNCGKRVIPGWIQDACVDGIRAALSNAAKADPEKEIAALGRAFRSIRVDVTEIDDYLGRSLRDKPPTPEELVELRGIYQAIRDGEATWQSVIENRRRERGEVVDDMPGYNAPGPSPDEERAMDIYDAWYEELTAAASPQEFSAVAMKIDSLPRDFQQQARNEYTGRRKAVLD